MLDIFPKNLTSLLTGLSRVLLLSFQQKGDVDSFTSLFVHLCGASKGARLRKLNYVSQDYLTWARKVHYKIKKKHTHQDNY